MIDRIEDEVTKTADHVDSGNKQLVEAGKKKRKARKVGNIIYTLVLLICFIMYAMFN